MISRDLLSLVLRRWYLMAVGAALTVGAIYVMTHQPGVYWTKVAVVLQAPVDRFYPNNFENPDVALAPMAGLVAADWNGADRPLIVGTAETTVYGEGLRQGVQVRMPNEGSQWQPLYTTPTIDVQVVGPSAEFVVAEAQRVSTELDRLLQERQADMGVQPNLRITTITSPATPTILKVSGSPSRSAIATGVVGAATTTIAVYWIDRWLRRRARMHRGSSGTGPEPMEPVRWADTGSVR